MLAAGGEAPFLGMRYTGYRMDRITHDPRVMGGKPCIRGMRVTVGTLLGLLAAGRTEAEILSDYPYLESEDIRAALRYGTSL